MLVSVMMPTYNTVEYLIEAIDSVINQTYQDLELIVVDDGSTDLTPEAMKFYDNPKIKYVRIEHSGIAAARNECLRHVQGEIVAKVDSDDIAKPDYIKKSVEALLENNNIIHSKIILLRENVMRDLTGPLIDSVAMENKFMLDPNFNTYAITIVAWKKVYDDVGELDPTFEICEDTDWCARALLKGYKIKGYGFCEYIYRKHSKSATRNPKTKLERIEIVKKYKGEWLKCSQ